MLSAGPPKRQSEFSDSTGVTLQQLMLLGGWRSFSMVLRYAHLAPDHLAVAAGKIRLKRRTKTGTSKARTRKLH